ncbi:MAG: hypothetical protein Q4A00_08270, partial [Flavobacteriaceae bacterium]|nr:hypothetical protein [Flavobacteriaceae bacterium]
VESIVPLSPALNFISRTSVSTITSFSVDLFPRVSSAFTLRIYFLFLSFFGFGNVTVSEVFAVL